MRRILICLRLMKQWLDWQSLIRSRNVSWSSDISGASALKKLLCHSEFHELQRRATGSLPRHGFIENLLVKTDHRQCQRKTGKRSRTCFTRPFVENLISVK